MRSLLISRMPLLRFFHHFLLFHSAEPLSAPSTTVSPLARQRVLIERQSGDRNVYEKKKEDPDSLIAQLVFVDQGRGTVWQEWVGTPVISALKKVKEGTHQEACTRISRCESNELQLLQPSSVTVTVRA